MKRVLFELRPGVPANAAGRVLRKLRVEEPDCRDLWLWAPSNCCICPFWAALRAWLPLRSRCSRANANICFSLFASHRIQIGVTNNACQQQRPACKVALMHSVPPPYLKVLRATTQMSLPDIHAIVLRTRCCTGRYALISCPHSLGGRKRQEARPKEAQEARGKRREHHYCCTHISLILAVASVK